MSQVTLHLGDCLEVMRTLDAGSVDAVICDPPYGTTTCKWDSPIPFAPMWEQIRRIVAQDATIVMFGVQPFTSALVMSNPQWFKYELIWDKIQTGAPGVVRFRPLPVHENLVVFGPSSTIYNPILHAGEPYKSTTRNGGNRHGFGFKGKYYVAENNGFRYQTSIVRKQKERHPSHETQKPVSLLVALVNMFTNPGDTVLDFCMGSGTTGVAAVKEGRHFVGVELDAIYHAIAAKRIAEAQMQLPLLSVES